MTIIDNASCGEKLKSSGSFATYFKVHENFICAEGHSKARTCHVSTPLFTVEDQSFLHLSMIRVILLQLDGGAPLICPLNGASNQYVLVGVLSWDIDCNKRELPTVFASVKPEIRWLQRERYLLNIF